MLKIRLQRIGRRNQPHFRVVVTESQNGPKSGRFYEVLGSYNPKLGTKELKNERITHWLSVGAQPTETVHNFLVDAKIIAGKKLNALPKKTAPAKKAEPVSAPEPKVVSELATPATATPETPATATPETPATTEEAKVEIPTEEASPEKVSEEIVTQETAPEEAPEEK